MAKISPESMARASSRHPWRTLGLWVVLIMSMGIVSSNLLAGVLSQNISFTNKPESVQAQDILDKKFPGTGPNTDTEFFIVSSGNQTASDPAFQRTVQAIKADLSKLPSSLRSGPIYTYVDAQAQAQQLFTPDGHGALIPLQLRGNPAPVVSKLHQALASAAPAGYAVQVLTPAQLALMHSATGGSAQGTVGSGPAPSQQQAGTNAPSAYVLVTSKTTSASAPAFSAATKTVERATIASVDGAFARPPASGYDLQAQAKSLVSANGKYALVPVTLNNPDDSTVQQLRGIASRVAGNGFTVLVAGNATLNADFTKVAQEDLRKGEGIGLFFALLVLIVVFAAIVAALLPIVMALFVAIPTALGLVALIGQLFHFNLFVENIVTMIGLAVGIDYSLFIVSRFREERRKGFSKLDAIAAAGATANRAVFFSGLTVVLALLGMFIIPTTIFRALAGGAMIVTIVSIVASMTLLPAILALLGDRINWPRLSRRARVEGVEHDPRGGFWDKVTNGVMKRPVVFLTVGVLVLGGLGSYYFQLHRGTSQSVSTLPSGFQSKTAFLTLQREFSAGGVTDPAKIVVTGNVQSSQVQAAVAKLRTEIANDPSFSHTTNVSTSSDGSTMLISAYFRGDSQTDPAFAAITRLRDQLVPAVFGGVSGTTVLVGGNTAFFTDFLHVADQYQWIVLAFVLGLSFILLTVVFRSIVLPVTAIIMNLLSVGAAYGAVTLVFQKGAGIGFFNAIGFKFRQADSIEAWLPLFLFSILFGLSMDYHVFLLTRIREAYDKTRQNTKAVAYGLRTTAGIITGAALIMVVVFTGFAAGRLGPLQQMGFGLAVAVLIDATIVRTLLVPASMRLLGDLNWYLPKWLDWLPQLHVEGREPTTTIPEAAAAPVSVEASER